MWAADWEDVGDVESGARLRQRRRRLLLLPAPARRKCECVRKGGRERVAPTANCTGDCRRAAEWRPSRSESLPLPASGRYPSDARRSLRGSELRKRRRGEQRRGEARRGEARRGE